MRTRPFAAILCTLALLAVPSSASGFAKAVWGVPYRDGANQFPLYRRLGARIDELSLDWSQIAPTRPTNPTDPSDPAYRWPTQILQAVTLARRFHMRVLLQINFSPAWANGGRTLTYPASPTAYAAFATAAARRYRSVHLWMIWGEPSRPANFALTPSLPPGATLTAAEKAAPHAYAQLLDAAYGALKSVSRRNLVIGGDTYTTGGIDTEQWIENLRLPDGRRPRMDMYGQNPFSYSAPSFSAPASPFGAVQFSDLPRLGRWIDEDLRPGMRIFLSEFTIPTRPDEEFNFYVDPGVAARWVTEALTLARRWHRIYALGWINIYDDPPLTYGGLLTASGQLKPDFRAFADG